MTNTRERIGLTLRTLRLCHGMTGEAMAAAMKVSPSMYDHYEAGRRAITWDRVQRAAWWLDIHSQLTIQPEAIALPSECGVAELTIVEGVAA
ncbi:helix-turn-helix domain-containing protein [Glutamicibacter sp. MCAF14]|uniref:helix-turn-helix domain-containing protein n=1 Tax=Glutamicibacter sp. MCAF14 TaxID=3233043 RepID=UPI003F8E49A9